MDRVPGTTVVVVPVITLRGDLQQRCAKLGISCVEWESRRPPDEASIVLVTPEDRSKDISLPEVPTKPDTEPTLPSMPLFRR